METDLPGLELIGWKLGDSGATAYGLLKRDSTTQAGSRIIETLDAEPGWKDVLVVFGEVDVSEHIGRHGRSEQIEAEDAVCRYVTYLRGISDRPDVGMVLVASMVPHHRLYRAEGHGAIKRIVSLWNSLLERACTESGLLYVDWHTPADIAFGDPLDGELADEAALHPSDPGECHMSPRLRPVLAEAVRAALLRYDH